MHRTDRMYERKWGVFIHYLHSCLNEARSPRSLGRETSWDDCIRDFDCDALAAKLAEVGAGYLVLTLQQQTKYFCAPNETFDRIAGYQPGEACSTIDLPARMIKALEPYDIDLFLYFTGDGPTLDKQAEAAFGTLKSTGGRVTRPFVEKWASVAREFSLRYGDKVKGWWMDGCYRVIGYDAELLGIWKDALLAGNPDAVLSFNYYGCMDEYNVLFDEVPAGTVCCDYKAGELVQFGALPRIDPLLGGSRWHILSFLGVPPDGVLYNGWGASGSKYTGEWMRDYVSKVHKMGGVVTMDICADRLGNIDPEQMKVLSCLRDL